MNLLLMTILVCLLAALLWVPRLAWLGFGTLPTAVRRHAPVMKWLMLLATGFWLVITTKTGARLDYNEYLMQWQIIVDAQLPPWGEHTTNAYGPLYNALALPYLVDPFLPKMLFVFVWMWVSVFLIGQALQRDDRPILHAWFIATLMLTSPYLAILIAHYGYFDILPAGLCLLAVYLRLHQHDRMSGAALAGAVLLKFYPLALLPFIMLDGRRLRIRIGAWCIVCVCIGMLAGGLIWGGSVLQPLTFAGDRPSKWLSIFRYLSGPYSPLALWMENPNADHLSFPAMVLFGGGTWLACWWRRVPLIPACVAGVAIALQFYKVGHIQFQILLWVLIMYWLVTGSLLSREHRPALIAVLTYLIWLTVFVMVYAVLRRYFREGVFLTVRDFTGAIGLFMTVWLTLAALKAPKPPSGTGLADSPRPAGTLL
jgi:hypothetical protein